MVTERNYKENKAIMIIEFTQNTCKHTIETNPAYSMVRQAEMHISSSIATCHTPGLKQAFFREPDNPHTQFMWIRWNFLFLFSNFGRPLYITKGCHYLPLNTSKMVCNFISVLPKKPVISSYVILNNAAQQSHQQAESSQIRKTLSERKQHYLFSTTCLQNKITQAS